MMRFHARYLLVLTALMLLTACSEARDTKEPLLLLSGPSDSHAVATSAPAKATSNDASSNLSQPSSLNAGEIDDNSQWGAYLQYRSNFLQTGYNVHDLNVSDKQT